jgi:hypothetical protein
VAKGVADFKVVGRMCPPPSVSGHELAFGCGQFKNFLKI